MFSSKETWKKMKLHRKIAVMATDHAVIKGEMQKHGISYNYPAKHQFSCEGNAKWHEIMKRSCIWKLSQSKHEII